MKRREFLERSAALGILAAIPSSALAAAGSGPKSEKSYPPLAPGRGPIPVAFLVSDGAVVIDFCGPWEVFQDAAAPGSEGFSLYTVAETSKPIHASAGMKIVPDHTFADAPAPRVIVIPAQGGHTPAAIAWIRKAAKTADMTMSVCTGAFLLAKTGLLAGKSATTHHSSFKRFAMDFADVRLVRGARWVDSGNVATAGGLSSGIDLALHVVERYFGREVAKATAWQMEYQGEGWMHADANAAYAVQRTSTDAHPLCVVCDMDVDPASAPRSVHGGKTYLFCSADHKALFDRDPARWLGEGN
ncbi:MAG TPA: DJ-1/PfpI family protein [Thermoanaerobaculia bacterium]|nr:DJ-1/PfpI family protein [Thermoanaerobaculia bacterium]